MIGVLLLVYPDGCREYRVENKEDEGSHSDWSQGKGFNYCQECWLIGQQWKGHAIQPREGKNSPLVHPAQ